jgi:hypothetical protein
MKSMVGGGVEDLEQFPGNRYTREAFFLSFRAREEGSGVFLQILQSS